MRCVRVNPYFGANSISWLPSVMGRITDKEPPSLSRRAECCNRSSNERESVCRACVRCESGHLSDATK